MLRIMLVLLSARLCSAAVLTVTGPASSVPGASIELSIGLTGSAGIDLTAVEWTHVLPAGVTLGTPKIPAGQPARMGAYCGAANCLVLCYFGAAGLVPPNKTKISLKDGKIAVVPVKLASSVSIGTLQLPLKNVVGASGAGVAVVVLSGPTYTLLVREK